MNASDKKDRGGAREWLMEYDANMTGQIDLKSITNELIE